jgi:PTS system fructose-specific IIC component
MVLLAPPIHERDALFARYAQLFVRHGFLSDADEVVRRLLDRESILSTGIGNGVAVPHAQISGLKHLLLAASTHPDGLAYPALDGSPVCLSFCLLGSETTTGDHLAGLARVARLARRPEALGGLIAASSGRAFVDQLAAIEESI